MSEQEGPRTAAARTRAITEGAMLVGITVIMAFIDRYIPVLSLFLAVPMGLLVVRRGLKAGVLAACVVTVLLFAMTGSAALVIAVDVAIAGLALGFAHLRFPKKPVLAFMVTAVGYILSFVLMVYGVAAILGATEAVSLTGLIDRFIETSGSLSEKMAELGTPNILADLEVIRPYLIMSIPALVVLTGAGNAVVVFLIFRSLLSRFGHEVAAIPPFRLMHLNWKYGWGFVLGLLGMTLGQLTGQEIVLKVGINLFWVFYMVFTLQGFSVLYYYFSRWKMSPAAKIFLLIIAIFTGIAQLAMTAAPWVGVLDAWFDFRKLEVTSDASDSDGRPEG